jgi:mannitol-1-phosphate 5-dehydrogenase
LSNCELVIIGAGKIGRSFIGQLFGVSGYKVTFIDIDERVVKLLNHSGQYRVVVKATGSADREIIVPNVHAISALDQETTVRTIATASLVGLSVGKNALEKVLPWVAEAIKHRYKARANMPLDIIIAENMINAADVVCEKLRPFFPYIPFG